MSYDIPPLIMKTSHKEGFFVFFFYNNTFFQLFSTDSWLCICGFLLSRELWCNVSAGINTEARLHRGQRPIQPLQPVPVCPGMSATSASFIVELQDRHRPTGCSHSRSRDGLCGPADRPAHGPADRVGGMRALPERDGGPLGGPRLTVPLLPVPGADPGGEAGGGQPGWRLPPRH